MTHNSTTEYVNPIIQQRADPWIYKHTDGYYYFTASVPSYDSIELRRSKTINGLTDAETITCWRKYESGLMSANIWAPEIHFINNKWYIYFAAARNDGTMEALFDHRMYVLECESSNPIDGPWVEKGQVKTNWESFSLDATTFEHRGQRYYVWAQKDPNIEGSSNLYIAPMISPWELSTDQVRISTPEFEWEKIGYLVNEGAAILKRNGRIFMTYSASATDHHYCVGLLWADENSNLLDPLSWHKSPAPIFQTNDNSSVYGPGHNSFTVAEDGVTDLIVYHARNYKEIEGHSLADPNRHTCVQPISWTPSGFLDLGNPVRKFTL